MKRFRVKCSCQSEAALRTFSTFLNKGCLRKGAGFTVSARRKSGICLFHIWRCLIDCACADANRNGLRRIVKHGEAASAGVEDIEIERLRLNALLSGVALADIYNCNETGLFAYAPPDRGLSTHQLSGSKTNSKYRITILVTCNASGTDMLEPLFIGRYAKPRCLGNRTFESRGFEYANNKTSWMNKEIFQK